MKCRVLVSVDRYKYILIATVFFIIVIFPLFISGFISDDAINSYVSGALIKNHQTVLEYTTKIVKQWMTTEGRFFPISFYGIAVFNLFQNLLAYKAFLFFTNVIDLGLFVYLLYRLTRNRMIINLFLITIPIFYSFHMTHDPILSFNGLLQVVLMFILGSLLFLDSFLKSNKYWYLFLSILFYCFSLATYEITYSFFLLHIVLIWFHYKRANNNKKILLYSLFFLGSAILFVAFSLWLRHINHVTVFGTNSPYSMNLSIAPVLGTYIKQLVGAFPLSFIIFNPDNSFSMHFSPKKELVLLAIPIGIILIMGICNGKKSLTKDEKLTYQLTFVLGLMLFLLPGVFVALSSKYQSYITWGRPYLPVFLEIFGLNLTLITAGLYLRHKVARWTMFLEKTSVRHRIQGVSIGLVAVLCFIILASNFRVVNNSNQYFLYPRKTIEYALEKGLLNNIPSDSVILVDSNYLWDNPEFYLMHSGQITQKILTRGSYMADSAQDTNQSYYLRYESQQYGEGYVVLAPLDELKFNNNTMVTASAKEAQIFFISLDRKQEALQFTGKMEDSTLNPVIIKESQLRLLSSGDDYSIWKIDNLSGMIDLTSLKIN